MSEGFKMKTIGTGRAVQSVQEEIKKKKNDSKVINHVLL